MSSIARDDKDRDKADQIASKFISKAVALIAPARSSLSLNARPSPPAKPDKWFNIESADLPLTRATSVPNPTQCTINVTLHSAPPFSNQILVFQSSPTSNSPRIQVDLPTPATRILLESWSISFNQHANDEIALSTVYKHSISQFRSLYTLLRVLPVWDLFKQFRRGRNGSYSGLTINVSSDDDEKDFVPFGTPLAPSQPAPPVSSYTFPPIQHPFGHLSLTVTYLSSPSFQITTVEALLSSRLLTEREGEFTPTLSRNSLSASPRAVPVGLPSAGGSGVSANSIADRFITRPASSPRANEVPLPSSVSTRARTPSLLTSSPSAGLGLFRGASPTQPVPPSPSASPTARRPAITPFKAPTLSSSPRISSLTGGVSGTSLPSTPGLPSTSRHSPTATSGLASYTPSTLADRERRSISVSGVPASQQTQAETSKPPTKRFSSTFSHRYSNPGTGSEGSVPEQQTSMAPSQPKSPSTPQSSSPSAAVLILQQRARRSSSPSLQPPSPRHVPLQLPPYQPPPTAPLQAPELNSLSDLDRIMNDMEGAFRESMAAISGNGRRRSESGNGGGERPGSRLVRERASFESGKGNHSQGSEEFIGRLDMG